MYTSQEEKEKSLLNYIDKVCKTHESKRIARNLFPYINQVDYPTQILIVNLIAELSANNTDYPVE